MRAPDSSFFPISFSPPPIYSSVHTLDPILRSTMRRPPAASANTKGTARPRRSQRRNKEPNDTQQASRGSPRLQIVTSRVQGSSGDPITVDCSDIVEQQPQHISSHGPTGAVPSQASYYIVRGQIIRISEQSADEGSCAHAPQPRATRRPSVSTRRKPVARR